MSRFILKCKVDSNQRAIVNALRRVGCFVQPLHMVGDGCLDLLAARGGQWFMIEVKDGSKVPSRRELTQDQKDWIADVDGRAPIHVVENEEQALAAVGVLRRVA